MLGFAAVAIIYVGAEELITESQLEKHTDIATIGNLVRFFSYDDAQCGLSRSSIVAFLRISDMHCISIQLTDCWIFRIFLVIKEHFVRKLSEHVIVLGI